MAHRLAPQAKVDIDDIAYYIFEATGNFELADRLVDSVRAGCLAGQVSTCRPSTGRPLARHADVSRG
jgi:hypothetical protein